VTIKEAGPQVKQLIFARMSVLAIPEQTDNPLRAGFDAIMTPGRLAHYAREATAWVEAALALVKSRPDNPYGDDDEAIAARILSTIPEHARGATP